MNDLTVEQKQDMHRREMKKFWEDSLDDEVVDLYGVENRVCECGGERTKTGHSHWCPVK